MEDLAIILISGGTVPNLSYQAFQLTSEMEVTLWDDRGIVLEISLERFGNKVYRAIKNVENNMFVGYADLDVHLASKRNKVATPTSALLPLSNDSVFIPAISGTDKIIGAYKGISSFGVCKHRITWPYTGGTIAPFAIPLIANAQGEITLPANANEIDKECEPFDTTASSFYQRHANRNTGNDIVDPILISEISEVLTNLSKNDSDIQQALTGLGSFPTNVYPQQQTLWSSETSVYNSWGNANFKAYRDFLKAYTESFKTNRAKILSGSTAEKMCQVARALDNEALKVLTAEEKLLMLEPLALQNINEFWFAKDGYNEEFLVLKIVNAFDITDTSVANANDITKFLDGLKKKFQTGQTTSNVSNLVSSVRWQISLFELLYNKVDDAIFGFGNENQKELVFALFILWQNSNYNPYRTGNLDENIIQKWNQNVAFGGYDRPYLSDGRPALLNYQSVKSGGIFQDSFVFSFGPDGDGIYWVEEGDIQAGYDFEASAVYDFYQPISLVSTKQDTFYQLPEDNNFIPPFFLKYIDDKGDESDFNTKVGLVIDAVSVASGIGAIIRLRHLRTLSQLGQLAVGLLELSSGAISFYLTYTDNDCDGDSDFCDKLKKFLFWIEVTSLSGDFLATQMARRSARDVFNEGKPSGFNTNAWDELTGLADIEGEFLSFLNSIENSYPVLHPRLVALNNVDEASANAFYFAFGNNADGLRAFDDSPELLDDWLEMTELLTARNSIDVLSAYKRFRTKNHEVLHITDISNKKALTGGFEPIGGHSNKNIVSGDILNPNDPNVAIDLPSMKIEKNGHITYKPIYIKKPTGATGGIEYPPGSGTLYYRKAEHTIWNPSWNDQRIREEMAYAFGNKVEVTRKTLDSSTGRYEIIYKSVLTDGTEVEIIFRSDDNFLNENYVGHLANMELKLE